MNNQDVQDVCNICGFEISLKYATNQNMCLKQWSYPFQGDPTEHRDVILSGCIFMLCSKETPLCVLILEPCILTNILKQITNKTAEDPDPTRAQ